jgi:cytochrome c peroxidase
MRLVDGRVDAGARDEAGLASAWAAGAPVGVRDGAGELDQDSSTQSWDDYRQTPSYAAYQPRLAPPRSSGYGASAPAAAYGYVASAQSGVYSYHYYEPTTCGGCAYPSTPTSAATPAPAPSAATIDDATLRALLAAKNVRPIAPSDFPTASAALIALGQALFDDPILSTNRDMACATCHVRAKGTSNALSLGPTLQASAPRPGYFKTVDLLPRNSPSLYNRGHVSFTRMFWDSRVARDPSAPSGFASPAGAALPYGLSSALAAQALFPLASKTEMLGCLGGSTYAGVTTGAEFQAVWAAVTARVTADAGFRTKIAAAYPAKAIAAIGIADLANAIAAYEASAFRSDDAPFDRYLRGDDAALTTNQKLGANLFYGRVGCATCHAGALQTDHDHHSIALPQYGPGLGDGPLGASDYGRARVTGNAADRYKFRTPSLRNVALAGPYGHDGAYSSLAAFVAHYTGPKRALAGWDRFQVTLPFLVTDQRLYLEWQNASQQQALAASQTFGDLTMTADEIAWVVAFLESLTEDKLK